MPSSLVVTARTTVSDDGMISVSNCRTELFTPEEAESKVGCAGQEELVLSRW